MSTVLLLTSLVFSLCFATDELEKMKEEHKMIMKQIKRESLAKDEQIKIIGTKIGDLLKRLDAMQDSHEQQKRQHDEKLKEVKDDQQTHSEALNKVVADGNNSINTKVDRALTEQKEKVDSTLAKQEEKYEQIIESVNQAFKELSYHLGVERRQEFKKMMDKVQNYVAQSATCIADNQEACQNLLNEKIKGWAIIQDQLKSFLEDVNDVEKTMNS